MSGGWFDSCHAAGRSACIAAGLPTRDDRCHTCHVYHPSLSHPGFDRSLAGPGAVRRWSRSRLARLRHECSGGPGRAGWRPPDDVGLSRPLQFGRSGGSSQCQWLAQPGRFAGAGWPGRCGRDCLAAAAGQRAALFALWRQQKVVRPSHCHGAW